MDDFSLSITHWYRLNKRELPWRITTDPYKIWLSEIILQQTRVDQGLNYYLKFIGHYPTVIDLARADEQAILNDWQGLGYYSRARNLHAAAKYICDELNGEFPTTFKNILKLKGVGTYTASAIASFAFNEVQAVVDGNVYRVLSRLFDISTPIDTTQGQKEFQELANSLIDKNNPAEHNQAIMEFGALMCTPKPNCENCPLQAKCLAFAKNSIESRPIKAKKTKTRNRYFHILVYSENGNTVIEQRTKKDVWQNMYQFPLIESEQTPEWKEDQTPYKVSETVKHILSHQHIHAKFYHFREIPKNIHPDWQVITQSDIQNYPLPRLVDRYLEEHGIE